MFKALGRFRRDERGGPVAEYALVIAVFAAATIAGLQAVSASASQQLIRTQTNLTTNAVSPP